MFAQSASVTVTTAADGSATAYIGPVTGEVSSLSYAKVDFANGVDFTITRENTAESLWTDINIDASETVRPVLPASLGTTGGASVLTERPIVLANERIKIVIAAGGDTKTGTFNVTLR